MLGGADGDAVLGRAGDVVGVVVHERADVLALDGLDGVGVAGGVGEAQVALELLDELVVGEDEGRGRVVAGDLGVAAPGVLGGRVLDALLAEAEAGRLGDEHGGLPFAHSPAPRAASAFSRMARSVAKVICASASAAGAQTTSSYS